jgi:sugar phosphate isomerase/epimerase
MKRRQFLNTAATIAGSAVLTNGTGLLTSVQAAPKRWKTAVGLNGFWSSRRMYGYKMELTDILQLIADCGYDGVELVDYDEPYPTTAAGIKKIKQLYDGYGLQIISLQARSRGNPPGGPDKAKRQQYLADCKQQVDFLQDVGSEFIGVWANGRIRGMSNEESAKIVADTWGELAEYAGSKGMYVVAEPEPVLVINTLAILKQVYDDINSPHFKVILDPSHAAVLADGDPFVFLKMFRGNIGHVHFTDNDGTQRQDTQRNRPGTSKHMTLGDGNLDIAGMLRELKNQNYDKWIMMDLWQVPDIYRATIVGKQKLDEVLDDLFPA